MKQSMNDVLKSTSRAELLAMPKKTRTQTSPRRMRKSIIYSKKGVFRVAALKQSILRVNCDCSTIVELESD